MRDTKTQRRGTTKTLRHKDTKKQRDKRDRETHEETTGKATRVTQSKGH